VEINSSESSNILFTNIDEIKMHEDKERKAKNNLVSKLFIIS
jgi:hypothetical protein